MTSTQYGVDVIISFNNYAGANLLQFSQLAIYSFHDEGAGKLSTVLWSRGQAVVLVLSFFDG